jgi:hypothetical protein
MLSASERDAAEFGEIYDRLPDYRDARDAGVRNTYAGQKRQDI